MNRSLLFAAALFSAAPATAASYSVGLSAAGPGKTSPTSFAGFNSSLGTLTRVDISLSGSTTYDITLSGSPPPSGTVSYNLTDGLFLYASSPLGNLTPQPYLQQTGTGTGPIVFGNFQATTSGTGGLTSFTDAASLAKFLGGGFSGTISVDDPFSASISVNGGSPIGLFGATIAVASKSVTGSVLYTYTPNAVVPEPATWAMMMLGVGTVGAAVRRRSRTRASLA